MKYIVVAFFLIYFSFNHQIALASDTDASVNAEKIGVEKTESKYGVKNFLRKIPIPTLDKLFLGGAVGQSFLDADFSNIYDIKDDQDFAFKLWLDYRFRERLYFEFELVDLGSNTIQASQAALATNVFPAQFSEEISYQQSSASILYLYPLPYEPFSVFAKGGVSYVDIESTLDVEVEDRFSPALGLGLQYDFKHYYAARFEIETFNKDAALISLGLSMRLGDPKPEKKVIQKPKEEPLKEPENVEEEQTEMPIEADVAEPVMVAQEIPYEEPEPAVDMEQLFAELKADIEPSSIFDKNSGVLSNRVMGNLDLVVYFLQTYPDVHVVITGYASEEGHEYLNENLSRLRSHGAKTYLQANGIDESRITARGRGEHFPRYSEFEEDYQIRNRRIEYDFYIPVNKK